MWRALLVIVQTAIIIVYLLYQVSPILVSYVEAWNGRSVHWGSPFHWVFWKLTYVVRRIDTSQPMWGQACKIRVISTSFSCWHTCLLMMSAMNHGCLGFVTDVRGSLDSRGYCVEARRGYTVFPITILYCDSRTPGSIGSHNPLSYHDYF